MKKLLESKYIILISNNNYQSFIMISSLNNILTPHFSNQPLINYNSIKLQEVNTSFLKSKFHNDFVIK